ncbi:hypothetical protein E0L36_24355 [Streptomyces sp. AJS327]|uniref:hypothetical protein n=1 Tax=Streptomyces sp. AJS327 TaxID=2545265 RepID=UPI0015DEB864|nr:hypothetical protein [Streptomyces sp. AJS327]MBA0053870.1 hypothetical protein [Streptomyces sp. AJS327]
MPPRARTHLTGIALALALAGTLTSCTDSSGASESDNDNPGAAASTQAAEPGKYRTLPEPCGAVSASILKEMLPGATGDQSDASGAAPYEGERAVTYDTDRRVGCRWKSSTTLGSHHLTIDLERVVSYDSAVSDGERAEHRFEEKRETARVPSTAPSETSDDDSGDDEPKDEKGDEGGKDGNGEKGDKGDKGGGSSPSEGGAKPSGSPSDSASASPDSPDDSPTPSGSLAPRPLDGVGDSAFLNDRLHTADSGVHRDITLVFRTANVIATVEYDRWVTDKRTIPGSEELQEKAQRLATELAKEFADD